MQMIQLSSVRRLVDVLDVEECDETGEVGNHLFDFAIQFQNGTMYI